MAVTVTDEQVDIQGHPYAHQLRVTLAHRRDRDPRGYWLDVVPCNIKELPGGVMTIGIFPGLPVERRLVMESAGHGARKAAAAAEAAAAVMDEAVGSVLAQIGATRTD